ncbi:unnamed protein product [Allacma fusca]|uniref:Uncharacterized protein n=1 Tax=Allacma fusca TaxID=39272 RepID=A0A8J2Q077_9HEXA|nr:unnamed protein product [Allacma fusca]
MRLFFSEPKVFPTFGILSPRLCRQKSNASNTICCTNITDDMLKTTTTDTGTLDANTDGKEIQSVQVFLQKSIDIITYIGI